MKTIVAGSRTIDDIQIVRRAIAACPWFVSEIVSGGAKGVDTLGELIAGEQNLPVSRFPADWIAHGRAAGPIRNIKMAEYADALIAIWDGSSTGTSHMIKVAKVRKLQISVIDLSQTDLSTHIEEFEF